jgi:hypothetical protein
MAAPDPKLVDFVKALARANAARDIAIAKGRNATHADGHLRPLQQHAAK